jgi:hypothetical protein
VFSDSSLDSTVNHDNQVLIGRTEKVIADSRERFEAVFVIRDDDEGTRYPEDSSFVIYRLIIILFLLPVEMFCCYDDEGEVLFRQKSANSLAHFSVLEILRVSSS